MLPCGRETRSGASSLGPLGTLGGWWYAAPSLGKTLMSPSLEGFGFVRLPDWK